MQTEFGWRSGKWPIIDWKPDDFQHIKQMKNQFMFYSIQFFPLQSLLSMIHAQIIQRYEYPYISVEWK